MPELEAVIEGPQKLIEGAINPVLTPFANCQLDEVGLEKTINYSIDHGVGNLFLLGHTGEFEHLPIETKRKVIDVAAQNRRKGIVIVGTSGDNLRETVELSRYAEARGADAIVLAPGFKSLLPADEYVDFVLKNTSVPVVLYNNPEITEGKKIDLENLVRLIRNPVYNKRVVAMKDSSGDKGYLQDLIYFRDNLAPWLSVLQGSETALMQNPDAKVDGIVAGSANFNPPLIARLYGKLKGYLAGRVEYKELESEFAQLRVYAEAYARAGDILEIKRRAHDMGLIASREFAPRAG